MAAAAAASAPYTYWMATQDWIDPNLNRYWYFPPLWFGYFLVGITTSAVARHVVAINRSKSWTLPALKSFQEGSSDFSDLDPNLGRLLGIVSDVAAFALAFFICAPALSEAGKKVLPLYVHVRQWVFVPFLMCLYLGTSALSCGTTAGITTRILRSPLLKTFGGYSFGIYLWQEPMFRLLAGTLGCKEISSREGVVFYIIMLLAYSVMWTDLVELPIVRSFRKLLQPCLPPNKVIFETDEMAQSASPFGTRRGRPASPRA